MAQPRRLPPDRGAGAARHRARLRRSASCPAAAHVLAAFASYSMEKRVSKHPEEFGTGCHRGRCRAGVRQQRRRADLLHPAADARHAGAPGDGADVGAFIIQGITPGPNVINDEPALFWGLIASMWVGNLMLVLLNLPLIGLWVRMLTVPYRCAVPGDHRVRLRSAASRSACNPFDVYAIADLRRLGYVLVKLGCEPAPLLLGFVLGPLLEEHLRRAMIISRGDPTIFVTRPISAVLLSLALVALVIAILPAVRRKREDVFSEEE